MPYVGYKLSPEARGQLLRAFPPHYENVVAHHVTTDFLGNRKTAFLPPSGKITVIGHAHDPERGIHAAVVRVGDLTHQSMEPENLLHITISHRKGARPVHSNDAIKKGWQPVKPFEIEGEPFLGEQIESNLTLTPVEDDECSLCLSPLRGGRCSKGRCGGAEFHITHERHGNVGHISGKLERNNTFRLDQVTLFDGNKLTNAEKRQGAVGASAMRALGRQLRKLTGATGVYSDTRRTKTSGRVVFNRTTPRMRLPEESWSTPKWHHERGEFVRVAKETGLPFEKLRRAFNRGRVAPVSDDHFGSLENTDANSGEHTTVDSVHQMGKAYGGKDSVGIHHALIKGDTLPAPIILHRPGKNPSLVAGNTRLTMATVLGKRPHALHVNVDEDRPAALIRQALSEYNPESC